MDEDTESGSSAGPLGELLSALPASDEPLPEAAVHPRVLRVDEPGERGFVLSCWADPGGARELHTAVRQRVEAALLAELSRPPSTLGEGDEPPAWLGLAMFAEVEGDVAAAVRAFGMRTAQPSSPGWRRALAHLRHEAGRVGRGVPDEPLGAWQAPVTLPGGALGETMTQIEGALAEQTGDEVWGAAPGEPCRRLGAELAQRGLGGLEPTVDGLRHAESHLVQREIGPVRWIPPAVFQALCDAAAVTTQMDLGRKVQWAVCEPDDAGLAPPPLIRVQRHGHWQHLPLGLVMLRWLVMPLQQGEDVPPFADWLADQLG